LVPSTAARFRTRGKTVAALIFQPDGSGADRSAQTFKTPRRSPQRAREYLPVSPAREASSALQRSQMRDCSDA